MKYIIKNCPAKFSQTTDKQGCFDDLKSLCSDCQDIPDCLLKRIAELCKEDKKPIRSWTEKGTCYDGELKKVVETDIVVDEFSQDKYLADNILNLLEIEEVE